MFVRHLPTCCWPRTQGVDWTGCDDSNVPTVVLPLMLQLCWTSPALKLYSSEQCREIAGRRTNFRRRSSFDHLMAAARSAYLHLFQSKCLTPSVHAIPWQQAVSGLLTAVVADPAPGPPHASSWHLPCNATITGIELTLKTTSPLQPTPRSSAELQVKTAPPIHCNFGRQLFGSSFKVDVAAQRSA